jgi:hypothetical protein
MQPGQEVDYWNLAVSSGSDPQRFIWEVVFLSCKATEYAISLAASTGRLKHQDFLVLNPLFLRYLATGLANQTVRESIYDEPLPNILMSALAQYGGAFTRANSTKQATHAMSQIFSYRCSEKWDNAILLNQASGMFTNVAPEIAGFLANCKFVG